MSAAGIQARIKAGLAKANKAVGSPDDLPIYLVKQTQSGTPLNPSVSESLTLLPNAFFKSYEQGLTDINIKSGDRQLVSDSDNTISQNNIIRQGADNYLVVSVDRVAPTGSPLVYISQVRLQ